MVIGGEDETFAAGKGSEVAVGGEGGFQAFAVRGIGYDHSGCMRRLIGSNLLAVDIDVKAGCFEMGFADGDCFGISIGAADLSFDEGFAVSVGGLFDL